MMLGWTEILLILILIAVLFYFRKSLGMETPSPDEEVQLAQSILGKLAVRPETDRRINEIFERLTEGLALNFPHYQLHRLDSPEINAIAIIGGNLVTTDGLINLKDTSDDELAGMLAHEIAHVELGHTRDAYYRENRTKVVKAALSILGRRTGSAAQVVEHLAKLGVSRESELEADRHAIQLLSRSRYSPLGLLKFLERAKESEHDREWLTFLSTHPALDERIRRLKGMLEANG